MALLVLVDAKAGRPDRRKIAGLDVAETSQIATSLGMAARGRFWRRASAASVTFGIKSAVCCCRNSSPMRSAYGSGCGAGDRFLR